MRPTVDGYNTVSESVVGASPSVFFPVTGKDSVQISLG